MPIMKKHITFCLVLMLCFQVSYGAVAQAASAMPALLISEVQTEGEDAAGLSDGRVEFIELYNPGPSSLEVNGWKVEYLSAGHDGTGAATRTLATLEGTITSKGYVLLGDASIPDADLYFPATTNASGYIARSGGHVRIVDAAGLTIDLLTWGTGRAIESWPRVAEIPAGASVQRNVEGTLSGVKLLAFAAPTTEVTPYGGGLRLPPKPAEPTCSGVVLTEILPNPSGTDSGREFVEVHNPTTESVVLQACGLRLGNQSAAIKLPAIALKPGEYRALYEEETTLTLPNASAQVIWLITSESEQGILYPDALADDEAWALINDQWQVTHLPSPGVANTATPASSSPERTSTDETPAACPAGKERNPDTGRCRAVVEAERLAPCKAGQERSAETNRCRAQASLESPSPCKAGQERNPETNRCRAVLAAKTSPKACAEGYVRNPDTNRCRKVVGTQQPLAAVQDVRTVSRGSVLGWGLVGLFVCGALGYAVYEWRADIANYIHARRQRSRRSKS